MTVISVFAQRGRRDNGVRRVRIRAKFNADTMEKRTQTALHLLLLPAESQPGVS